MELSRPMGCSPTPIFPTPSNSFTFKHILPPTSLPSAAIPECVDLPSLEPMVVDPNPSTISYKTIHNQHTH